MSQSFFHISVEIFALESKTYRGDETLFSFYMAVEQKW